MTVNTSRPAVEALIADLTDPYATVNGAFLTDKTAADALAALLDERDRLAANRDAWVSDAMTSTTELEQRIRDLEADLAGARGVRDRERGRAERAEAERVKWLGIAREYEMEFFGARGERDKLAAKFDAVKAWATAEDKATEMSWSDYSCGRGDAAREVLAILADTDEGNGK